MDREPLTTEHLREIGQRRRGDADVVTLLWEIKRLRAYVVRLDQVHRSNYRIPKFLQEAIENELSADPYVIASRANDQPKVSPGDDE